MKRFVIATVLGVGSATASADLITSGYSSFVGYRDCSSAATSCVDVNAKPATGLAADTSVSPDTALIKPESGNSYFESLGTTSAQTLVSGDLLSPVLKASIEGGDNAWVSAQGVAVQRYVNTGPNSITVALNALLDFTVIPGNTPTGDLGTGVIVQMDAFEMDSGLIDVRLGNELLAGLDLQNYVVAAAPIDHLIFTTTDLFFTDMTTRLVSPSFELDPGEGFFAGIRLVAAGGFGGKVDAFNTLRTEFTDGSGAIYGADGPLRIVGVPEPSTLSLFAAGLLGIGLLRRRRAA